jgi:uncharacterized protein (DUF433 family)
MRDFGELGAGMLIISGDFHSGESEEGVCVSVTTDGTLAFGHTPLKNTVDMANGYGEHIVRDERICGGEPIFKGPRVTLRTVLASLTAGEKVETILEQFPTLKAEHIQAAKDFRG